MAIHAHVTDVHEAGLVDHCERCAEMAEAPWRDLDAFMLRDLVDRTLRNRFGSMDAAPSDFGEFVSPRSDTEARAMANVMTLLERCGALLNVAPEGLTLYLEKRWHLDLAKYATPFS